MGQTSEPQTPPTDPRVLVSFNVRVIDYQITKRKGLKDAMKIAEDLLIKELGTKRNQEKVQENQGGAGKGSGRSGLSCHIPD
jgi:hypothetical protein